MIHTLSATDLSLTRGERTLFRSLSFSLAAGQAVALTGANGAGKTSLLRAVAGFIRPEVGEIVFRDADDQPIEADLARAHEVHLLSHLDGLKGQRTARDELMFQSQWLGRSHHGIDEAIQTLGLKPLLDLEVRKLSAGQRRRLALARLIGSPRALWLLDEPLSPLDAKWREAVGAMMARHLAGGGLILAAVHDPLPVPTRPLDLGAGR
ncbi:heme ABC exporter ATP-binding protein CcmA [Brevundimonas sp. NIBR11]|uniref:heme ABC exporter ATP-binding protein CcmA n=1 Tax=Brevundimonas sp. NIBR11 TaxID=3015999 RepID=UPI0022F1233A|nr:heme ABC exporter ATP-binding protein CcmA [Brevundimonas sp. NIBR11]WGM29817.1 Cytochrome c biogenesis ATP-binding export protein CcmA [Brevundimonas sp. NIBR11]